MPVATPPPAFGPPAECAGGPKPSWGGVHSHVAKRHVAAACVRVADVELDDVSVPIGDVETVDFGVGIAAANLDVDAVPGRRAAVGIVDDDASMRISARWLVK